MTIQCRRYLVTGRVQGVFFRAGTQETAHRLGLTGWVRNRADGAVELVACGEETGLAQLATWLEHGPPSARVSSVESSPAEDPGLSGFELRFQNGRPG